MSHQAGAGRKSPGQHLSVADSATRVPRRGTRLVDLKLVVRAWDDQRVGFVVDRLPKVHASDDLDGDDRGDYPIDDHAEGRPPPRVRNEVGSVLPEVFEAVTDETDD